MTLKSIPMSLGPPSYRDVDSAAVVAALAVQPAEANGILPAESVESHVLVAGAPGARACKDGEPSTLTHELPSMLWIVGPILRMDIGLDVIQGFYWGPYQSPYMGSMIYQEVLTVSRMR